MVADSTLSLRSAYYIFVFLSLDALDIQAPLLADPLP